MAKTREYVDTQMPDLQLKLKRLEVGPSTASKIEIRFDGADPEQLRLLDADLAKAEAEVNKYGHNLTQGQFDCLVDMSRRFLSTRAKM